MKAFTPISSPKWEAFSSRDEKAASTVLLCKSTGIYCRPTCAARLVRKKNVVFYDTVSEAEAAGFRPCNRSSPCFPYMSPTILKSGPPAGCWIISQSAPGLENTQPKNVGFTQWHFHRVFPMLPRHDPAHVLGGPAP